MGGDMQGVDEALAKHWPDRWAKANNPALPNRSKARNNLRRQWREAERFKAFVVANPNARCGNCADRSEPASLNGRSACDQTSDFHGYTIVDPAKGVCADWRATQPGSTQHG